MGIKMKQLDDGRVVIINTETGEIIDEIVTMGDMIDETR